MIKLSDRKLKGQLAETVMKRYLAIIRPSLTSNMTQMRKTWMKWKNLGTMAKRTLKMAMKTETIIIKPRTNRILLTKDSLISRAAMSLLGKTWVQSDHSPVLIRLQRSNMHPIAQMIFHRTTKCHTECKRTLPQTRAKLDWLPLQGIIRLMERMRIHRTFHPIKIKETIKRRLNNQRQGLGEGRTASKRAHLKAMKIQQSTTNRKFQARSLMKRTVAIQTINKINILRKPRRLNKKRKAPTQTVLLNPYHSNTRQDRAKIWTMHQCLMLQVLSETKMEIMINNTNKSKTMFSQLLSNVRSMCLISIWTWFQMKGLILRARGVHLNRTLITIFRVPLLQTTSLRSKCSTT